MQNKNKIEELEKQLQTSRENLTGIMNLLDLAISEMKLSFSSIFKANSQFEDYFITPELEKFEKKWLNYLADESTKNEIK